MNRIELFLDAAAFGLYAHSAYVVFRAFEIRDDTLELLSFWDALHLAAAQEFAMLPLYIVSAVLLNWFWRSVGK